MRRIFATASFRLTLLYACLFCCSIFLLVAWLYFSVHASLEQQARAHVEADMAQLLGDYRDDGLDELRHDIRERIEKNTVSRLSYAVQRPDGRAIFDRLPKVAQPGWHRFDAPPLLVKAEPLDNGYMLVLAADMGRVQAMESLLLNRLFLALAATIILGALGGLWASSRFLARVDTLATTAGRIGDGFLSERIPLRGNNDEFDQLAATINRMLARIETLVGNLQQVSTNIAHDLRTPLGSLRRKLEAMPDSDEMREAIALLDEMLGTFSALLRIAEIESGAQRAGFTSVDLSQLMQHVAESYQPVAEEAGYSLAAEIAPAVLVWGDRSLLMQLCANLVENAIRHGKGPIRLVLDAEGRMMIADAGEGIPAAEREEVCKPFYRLDRSRHTKGNGLGLSLAQAIAALHGVQMRLEDNSPGLRVVIEGWKREE